MAVLFRHSSEQYEASEAGVHLGTKPTNAVEGDVMLAFVHARIGIDADGVPGPYLSSDDWVKVADDGAYSALFYRVVEADEPGTYEFEQSHPIYSSILWMSRIAIVAYSSVSHADPIDAYASWIGRFARTIVAPSVTPANNGTRVVTQHHLVGVGAAITYSPGAGVTIRRHSPSAGGSSGSQHPSLIGDFVGFMGATGDKTATHDGSISNNAGGWQVALRPANVPPNAPTGLSPDGITINKDQTRRFTVPFSDDDAGDSSSRLDIRYRVDGTATWTTVSKLHSEFYDFDAGTFATEDYEWQARHWDALGEVGPWSSSAFFAAASPPDGPTITVPTPGATIPSADYTGTISYPDMDSWEWRVVGADDGAPDDTNVIIDATTESADTRDFPMVGLPNGTDVWIQVRVTENELTSPWVSSAHHVTYTPPATPTVAVLPVNDPGVILMSATHPTPTGSQPSVTSVDWWRRHILYDAAGNFIGYDPDQGGETGIPLARGAGLPPSEVFADWQIASGSTYGYKAVAHGDNQTTSASDYSEPAAAMWDGMRIIWDGTPALWPS